MKIIDRQAAIALGAVVLLGLIYLAVSDSSGGPITVDQPLQMGPVAELERVELSPPPGEGNPELIALERRGEQWWLARPVEAKADPRVAAIFVEFLTTGVGTDDLLHPIDDPEAFGLGDDRAVHMAAFGVGDSRPAVELLVGDGLEAPATGARRTFVKEPGGDGIYRLQAGLDQLVRLDVDELAAEAPGDVEESEHTGDGESASP